MAINAILTGFSTAAYTVFGLYFKLRSFVFMPVLGLNQGLMPIICLCFPLAALGLVSSNMYQAIGRGNYSLVMSLMRQLVVLVPVAWLLAKVTNDVSMVWLAFPIAEAVSLAVSMMFFTHLYKTELKK